MCSKDCVNRRIEAQSLAPTTRLHLSWFYLRSFYAFPARSCAAVLSRLALTVSLCVASGISLRLSLIVKTRLELLSHVPRLSPQLRRRAA